VPSLLAQGHSVRALARSATGARELATTGAQVVVGDLTDRESLLRACTGVQRVLAAAHSAFGRGRYRSEAVDDLGHRALVDAARAAGVQRFVYISAMGAAPSHPVDFFRTKYAVERYLRNSGLSCAILRPTSFMEWHAHRFNGKPLLDSGRAIILGSGTKRRNFVAARDVAQIAIRALTAPEPPPQPVEVGGPGNYTNDEVAQLYAREAGIAPRIRHVPALWLRAMAPVVRVLHPGIARVLALAGLPDDAYDETFDATVLTRDYPIDLTTLPAFIRERVAETRVNSASS